MDDAVRGGGGAEAFERRRGDRSPVALNAEITVGKTRIPVETVDVSRTGALFRIPGLNATLDELAEYVGRRLRHGFSVSFGGIVRCSARLARVSVHVVDDNERAVFACRFVVSLTNPQCEMLGIPRRSRVDNLLD